MTKKKKKYNNFYNYVIIPILVAIITGFFTSYLTKSSERETREFKIRYDLYTDFIIAYNNYINDFKLLKNYNIEYEKIIKNKGIEDKNVILCKYNKPLNCTNNKDYAYIIGKTQDMAYRNTIYNIEKKFRIHFLKLNLLVNNKTFNKIHDLIRNTLYIEPNNYNNCLGGNSPLCGFNFNLHNKIITDKLDIDIISILKDDLINFK